MQNNDTQFGLLSFDPKIGWWEGQVVLPSGSSFELFIHTPSESDTSISDATRETYEKIRYSENEIRLFASKELLAIHNSEWNEGDKIDEDEFVVRLIPSSIELWPDGDAEIAFEDDDLFWGHEVGVRYRGGKYTEAVVQG